MDPVKVPAMVLPEQVNSFPRTSRDIKPENEVSSQLFNDEKGRDSS